MYTLMLFWQFVLLLHFRFSEIQNFPSGIAHRHSNTKLHVIKTLDNRILLYIEKVEHFLPSPFMENYYLRKQRWYFVTAILKPSKYTKYISFFLSVIFHAQPSLLLSIGQPSSIPEHSFTLAAIALRRLNIFHICSIVVSYNWPSLQRALLEMPHEFQFI